MSEEKKSRKELTPEEIAVLASQIATMIKGKTEDTETQKTILATIANLTIGYSSARRYFVNQSEVKA